MVAIAETTSISKRSIISVKKMQSALVVPSTGDAM
jgi:hypothetical protein